MVIFLFLLVHCQLFAIFVPQKTAALKEPIESREIDFIFRTASTFVRVDGDLWDISESGTIKYVSTCSENSTFAFLTNEINTTQVFADVIYVAMETNLRPKPNRSNSAFDVYLYNGSAKLPGKFDSRNFSYIYTVNNETASSKQGDRWTHVFKFAKNGSERVIFGVKSVDACVVLYSIKVYYYYCEEKNDKGVTFPKTMAPSEGKQEVSVNCSMNTSLAHQTRTLSAFCGYNGTWSISNDTECYCRKGYEKKTKKCLPCPDNHFKAVSSNESCKTCPNNSVNSKNRTSCECIKGYYHITRNADATIEPCYGLITEKLKLTIKEIGKGKIRLSWNEPVVADALRVSLKYEVKCLSCSKRDQHNCKEKCNVKWDPMPSNITQTSVVISDMQPSHRYVFSVYPKTVINDFTGREMWNISLSERTFSFPSPIAQKQSSYFDYVVISGIGSGVLFMIMVALLVVVIKRKSDYRRHLVIGNQYLSRVELPALGQKTYVDPTNYDSPEDALNEFANELDPSTLVLEKLIGGGEFGDVYKGVVKTSEGKCMSVAVKTLKHNHTEKNEKDFLLEASVMGQFHNPNVIHLEGVITASTPRMIVTEYMSNGSLDRFLRSNDGTLTNLQLVGMARGVASGMAYLSAMNFIHRDLAARNILVNDDLLCKITDFGLSRSLETAGSDGEYDIHGGKIPLRWTAPEAINYRKFSSSSDVWSYGILLWEIMSFGDRPYWEWDNHEVVEKVNEGFRLPAPKDCPEVVHKLMLLCWKTNRCERPSFERITKMVSDWIRSPEIMLQSPSHDAVIGIWLQSIKMGSYTSLFINAGYESKHQLVGIRDEELRNIGVKLIGHRNKILKAVRAFEDLKTEDKPKVNRASRAGSITV